jgi:hypothetical protein
VCGRARAGAWGGEGGGGGLCVGGGDGGSMDLGSDISRFFFW